MERSPRVPVSHGQRVAEPGLLPRLSERLTALRSPISKRVCGRKGAEDDRIGHSGGAYCMLRIVLSA